MSDASERSATTRHVQMRYEPRAGDHESVREIVTATGVFRRAEIEVAVELIEERLAKGVQSGYEFIFAEHDNQTIGYACYGHIACTIGSYDLYWLAVLPEEQRQRAGRLLLAEVEKILRRQAARRLYIETSDGPRYVAARAFYESRGYLRSATLHDYYAQGDSKIIYEKSLLS